MNTKKILGTFIAAGILHSCSLNTSKENENIINNNNTIKQNKEKLIDTLTNNIKEDTETLRTDIVTIDIQAIKESNNLEDKVLLKHIKNRYKSMKVLLGGTDASNIMSTYNAHVKNNIHENINNIDTLHIPRISPSLKGFFNNNLSDFLASHDTISTLVGNNKHVIITTKNDVGMFSTGVYINGKLQYAYAASPGKTGLQKDRKGNYHAFTPLGSYIITRAQADKKSDKNDYMAFYLGFYDPRGIGHHGSQLVNGKISDTQFAENGQSHGCIRGVHIYRYLTYKDIKPLFDQRKSGNGAPIAVVNYRTPSEKEKKDAEWYITNKTSLDYSWENDSYIKPVLSAQNIGHTNKIDTIDLSKFAYLYGFKDSILEVIQMRKAEIEANKFKKDSGIQNP